MINTQGSSLLTSNLDVQKKLFKTYSLRCIYRKCREGLHVSADCTYTVQVKYTQPFLDKLQWCKSSKTPVLIRDFSDFLPLSGQVWLLLSLVWDAWKQVGGAIISQGSEESLVLLDLIVLMFISIEQSYHKVINPGICSQTVLSQNESCFISSKTGVSSSDI